MCLLSVSPSLGNMSRGDILEVLLLSRSESDHGGLARTDEGDDE